MTKEALKELKQLEDRKGRLTPEQVLEAASDPKSALHSQFEWDDSKAAYAHRLDQARELIRRVKIELVVEERTIKAVAYVRDPDRQTSEPGYINSMRVTKRTAGAVLTAELNAIYADLKRAYGIAEAKSAELPGAAAEVARIMAQVDTLIARL